MSNWYLVTVIGEDQPGIVARVTRTLANAGCHLADTSMIQMANNFTIMMMLQTNSDQNALESALSAPGKDLGLRVHIDTIKEPHITTPEPNVRVSVHGADRAGIIADITGILAANGFNIIDLESARAGRPEAPIYILHIEGSCIASSETLSSQLKHLIENGIDIRVDELDTLIG